MKLNFDLGYDKKRSDLFSSISLGILSPEQILERSHGEILKPESTLMFRLTANLRSFVGDNFSFTTFLLSKSPIFVNIPQDKSFSSQKVNKATELITKLHALVSANGAHLYVIPFPNRRNKADEERNNLVTHLEAEVRKELERDTLKKQIRLKLESEQKSNLESESFNSPQNLIDL